MVDLSDLVAALFRLICPRGGHDRGGWLYYIKTPVGRAFWDARRIKLPIFGGIAHKICLARFTRTMASLVRGRRAHPGSAVHRAEHGGQRHHGGRHQVRLGGHRTRARAFRSRLAKHPIFPTMIIRMITAGEQTGKIDAMLERVADFLDEEIETTLSGLTSLIEPLLIVFLGVVVGGIVICMFLPIFKLSELVSGRG